MQRTSRQFGILLGVIALLVGYVFGIGLFESGDASNSYGIPFWMGGSALAFLISFGMHLLLHRKKDSMESKGEVSEEERMFEPFYGTALKEKLGVVLSVVLLGSLPVVIVPLAFRDLQPEWISIFTGFTGFFVLLIIAVYTVILFKNSREFYDRYETYIVPLLLYLLSMSVYKYSLSFQAIPPIESVSWYAVAAVMYTAVAIPFGVKLLLSANRTIYDKKARAEDELEFASEVQKQFLQDRTVNAENVQGFGRSIAAREVGGDFFYVDKLEDDQSVVAAVGDVSGHSFGAGLIMSMLVTMTEDHLWYNNSPNGLLERLNKRLRAQDNRSLFATMGVVQVLQNKIRLWNAGHMPVLKYSSADGTLTQLKASGMALGMTGQAGYSATEFPLTRGDQFFLYSDGLVETRGDTGQIQELPDFEAVVKEVVQSADSPDDIAREVIDTVLAGDTSDYPEDDMTIVVIRAN